MYVRTFAYVYYTHPYMHICIHNIHTYKYTYIHTYTIYTYMYVCMYVFMYVHTSILVVELFDKPEGNCPSPGRNCPGGKVFRGNVLHSSEQRKSQMNGPFR